MHSKRILTAAVLVPLAASIIFWGGALAFAITVLMVTGLCLYEFYCINFPSSGKLVMAGVAAGLLPVASVMLARDAAMLPFAVYLVLVVSVLLTLATYSRQENPFLFMTRFMFGALYIGVCASFILLIRYMPIGREWIFFLLTVIFLGDAGAYYTGKAMGRRKLCKAVSGGKTVEGALGGVMLNAAGAAVLWLILFRHEASPFMLIPAAMAVGITGQIGDLAESVVKRACGVKDSGCLLPGHGGFLDRVDALLLAAPFFHFLLSMNVFKPGP
jgi:phosphatidate cytidylyltransferase